MAEKRKRSVWRRAAWVLIAIVIALPLIAVLAILALRTSPVQSYALGFARGELSALGIEIGAVSGDWPDEIIAENVTVSDAQGVWLTVERARIRWSSWSLLGTTAVIQSVELTRVHMVREPVTTPSERAPRQFKWPSLPFVLDIKLLRGDGVIARAVTGEEVAVAFEGAGQLDNRRLTARFAARQTNGEGQADLELQVSSDLRGIKLVGDARDAGVLAAMSGDEGLSGLVLKADIIRDGETWSGGFFTESAGYGTIDATFIQDGFLRLRIPESKPIATKLDLALMGKFEVLLRVVALSPGGTTSLDIFADTSQLRSDDDLLSRLLEEGLISSRLNLTPDSSVIFENIAGSLAAGRIRASGYGRLNPDDTLYADVTAEIADLSAIDDQGGGSSSVHAIVTGAGAAPQILLDLSGTEVRHGQLSWTRVTGKARFDAQGLGTAVLSAEGRVPIDLTATIAREGEVRVADVSGTALGAEVKANVRLEDDRTLGTARVRVADIAPAGQFAGLKLSGAVDLDGRFTRENDGLRVNAQIRGRQIQSGTITFATLNASAEGPMSGLALTADGKGQYDDEPLTLSTQGVYNNDSEILAVARLTVTQGDFQASLARRSDISLKDGFAVEKAQIQLTRNRRLAGTIVLSAKETAAGFTGELSAAGLDLRSLCDDELMGIGALSLTFDGVNGRADATAEVSRLRSLGGDARLTAPLDVTAKANWGEGRLAIDGTATGRNVRPAKFALATRLPRAPDGGIPELPDTAPLEGSLAWSGRIGPLFSALDLPGQMLDGDSEVNLAIKGTVAQPRLEGTAFVRNGHYENELSGATLTDLVLNADARAQVIRVSLSAKDGGSGMLEGNIAFDPGLGLVSTTGRVTATNALIVKRDDVTARVTGDLSAGPGEGEGALKLSGRLTVRDVTAQLPKSLPPEVVVVDVVDPAAPPLSADKTVHPNKSVPVELDLRVDIPGPAALSGRGLQSFWRGKLAVKGLVSAPEISGTLTAMRGGIDLAGERLELGRGEIRFDGSVDLDPQMDIAFEGKSRDIETEIVLTGRVSALGVEARSTPPLPQDEILARALFGKPSTQLSAGEALQLVRSVAELSGQTTGGYDLVSKLQARLGVDVLRVEGLASAAGPSVTAGQYVSQGVYVGVRQGARPGSTAATVEIEVTNEITLETDVGQDTSSSIGLNWKHDY